MRNFNKKGHQDMYKIKDKIYIIVPILILVFIALFKYNHDTNIMNKIEKPDSIKIHYSNKEVIINKEDKMYGYILKLNKKRLIRPLVMASFVTNDPDSFKASDNRLEISPKYNNGLVTPIYAKDLMDLRENINIIEYLYEDKHTVEYKVRNMYKDEGSYDITVVEVYSKILYTVTDGDIDLMIFGAEGLKYNGIGFVLETSKKLGNYIKEQLK